MLKLLRYPIGDSLHPVIRKSLLSIFLGLCGAWLNLFTVPFISESAFAFGSSTAMLCGLIFGWQYDLLSGVVAYSSTLLGVSAPLFFPVVF